jgi:hypothetical protein
MKKILIILALLTGKENYGQVSADPATGQMDITTMDGISLNANFIAPNSALRLTVPVYNLSQLNTIPAGTCKLNINLGNRFVLDPSFSLAAAALNNYFTWTSTIIGGLVQINGDLVAPLPGDFTGLAAFNIKAKNSLGTSEIITNFNVTNHNSSIILTDEDPNNNFSSLQYTITNETIPVHFTSVSAARKGCNIILKFSAESEINVKKYEIEAAGDGIHFLKYGELKADNGILYQLEFTWPNSGNIAPIFIRIKAVDNDGTARYSETKTVKGICETMGMLHLIAFPNPAIANNVVDIRTAGDLLLNGHYFLVLTDITGRVTRQSEIDLSHASQFVYKPGGLLAPGNYFLKIRNSDSTATAVLKIVKL